MLDRIKRNVLLLSDGIGETAETITGAALKQFHQDQVQVWRIGNIRTESQVRVQLDKAKEEHALVFFTFVNYELATFTEQACREHNIDCLDLFTPILRKLAHFFGHSPQGIPGLLHQVGPEYFQRVEAMDFALKNDDGQTLRHLNEADVVLVGISRTSKTPVSIYLSCQGWKVANVPLVQGTQISPSLFAVDPRKVIGLFLDVKPLVERREVRVNTFGMSLSTDYINPDEVKKELGWARGLCRDRGWTVVHVAGKSVEEIAYEILVNLGKK